MTSIDPPKDESMKSKLFAKLYKKYSLKDMEAITKLELEKLTELDEKLCGFLEYISTDEKNSQSIRDSADILFFEIKAKYVKNNQ